MSVFKDILTKKERDLNKIFSRLDICNITGSQLVPAAEKLKLKPTQLIFALGFNRHIQNAQSMLKMLGYDRLETLTNKRNQIFVSDVYDTISLSNILTFYGVIKDDNELLQIIRYLLQNRLIHIESSIEDTINTQIIEKYKAEVKAIYSDKIVDIDFAEERLNRTESGFRALLNEVSIIAENKLIPVGDIFFREAILPEEKRKLLDKNLIPAELVKMRIEQNNISSQERHILRNFLKRNPVRS